MEEISTNKHKYIPPVIVSPEVYGLPKEMDPMAQYVTRKGGGGMGDVKRAKMNGFFERGIPAYSISPNFKTIFMNNTGMSPDDYLKKMKTTQRERVLLVSSPHFSYLNRIYDGNVTDTAALLQELSLPLIKNVYTQYDGRAVVNTYDQYGGLINAYCKARGIASVHTVHNGLEFILSYDAFKHTDLTEGHWGIKIHLYDTSIGSRNFFSHATSIKNADIVTFVGRRFYEEILEGRYRNTEDWPIFKESQAAFREIEIKADNKQTRVILNAIAPEELPENQDYLKVPFGPHTHDIVGAKRANKLAFQEKMGLKKDPDAILLYWPSRIDQAQKGIESLLGCAKDILYKYPDVQIAIVGDAQGDNVKYLGQIYDVIKQAPEGSMKHASFDKQLSNQGYASATGVLGASRYEPFGLFWLQGICAGAFGLGAANGGAVDILRNFNDRTMTGNGILCNNSDVGGMRYDIETLVPIVRNLQKNPELYNKVLRNELMLFGRENFSQDKMVEGYLMAYDDAAAKHDMHTDGYLHFIDKTKNMPSTEMYF